MTLADRAADVFASTGEIAARQPQFRSRTSQIELTRAIADTIESDGCLMAEAGTGTGKTFSYLVPALLSGRKIILSTGTRQLQDQLYQRDLVQLRQWLGIDVELAILKGRSNYVCPFHLQRHLADGRFADRTLPGKLRLIEQFARIDPVGDKSGCTQLSEDDPAWQLATSTRDNCLGQECPELRQCPLVKARQRAQRADILVVNHHLFCADMALQEDAVGELLPLAQVYVFDEAHQLPETATDFFGDSVSTRQLIDLGRDTLRAGLMDAADGADWRDVAGRLEQAARELRLQFPQQASRFSLAQLQAIRPATGRPLGQALAALADLLAGTALTLTAQAERSPDLQRCAARADALAERTRRWLARFDPGAAPVAPDAPADPDAPGDAVLWAQTSPQQAALRSTPLTVSRQFAEQRERLGGAWVFLSATLAVNGSLAHFAASVGLGDARRLILASPFDYPRQSALWLPDDVGPTSAADFPQRVARRVWPLIERNRGRAFVLCTTLRAVAAIAEYLRAAVADRRRADDDDAPTLDVLVQSDAPRHELLERFRRSRAAVLVGSASFWEGVDVAGDGLSLVVIDKLPFAPPDDPVVQARSKAIEAAGGNAFAELSLPAAALSLKQGAGRLIRSESDRGLLVICDERLRTRAYGNRILASLPPFRRVGTIEEAQAFLPG